MKTTINNRLYFLRVFSVKIEGDSILEMFGIGLI